MQADTSSPHSGPPAPPKGGHGLSWAVILACLAFYTTGFLLWRPAVMTVVDESSYIRQAVAFAEGTITVPRRMPFTHEVVYTRPSRYPAGTSLLQAPLVLAGGWRAASLLSLFSVIGTTLLLALWLRDAKRSPLFALLFLGYMPVLVLGRVAMSDVPSALVAVLGLWMFWRGLGDSRIWWLGAGFLAGVSVLFRDANPLLFVFLFAGALWRRGRAVWLLVAGGLAGVGLRLVSAAILYGDPFFIRDPLHGLDFVSMVQNAPVYLVALLVMVPGGLAGALLYRGRCRPEVLLTIVSWVLFFFAYEYSGRESGALKRLVHGPRFLIPLLPLLVFAMAESIGRIWARWRADGSLRGRLLRGARVAVVGLWVPGVALAAFSVHPAMDRYNRSQAAMVEALYGKTTEEGVIVTNLVATIKFINEVYGSRVVINRSHLQPSDIPRLLAAEGRVQIAFLDRRDSDYYREDAALNDTFVRDAAAHCRLVLLHDRMHTSSDHLRIWEVQGCGQTAGGPP